MCIDTISHNCFESKRVNSKTLKAGFEKKTTYQLNNEGQKTISKISFDLCKGSEESCCDHLFIVEDRKIEKYIFIELKDSRLLKAINQINISLDKYQHCLKGKEVYGRIITTKTYGPALKSSEYIKLKKRLKDNLITRSQKFEEHA